MDEPVTTRLASLTGTLIHYRPGTRFRGAVELESRDDCVYSTWRIEAEDGEFLGSVSRPVSLRTIPPDSDPFEFALAHTLEGIRRYRFGRVRPFQIETCEWSRT
jgi:hypothetical protein